MRKVSGKVEEPLEVLEVIREVIEVIREVIEDRGVIEDREVIRIIEDREAIEVIGIIEVKEATEETMIKTNINIQKWRKNK